MVRAIESEWNLEGTSFALSVTIPVNIDALVYLPGEALELDGATFLRDEDGFSVLSVSSGRYRLTSKVVS